MAKTKFLSKVLAVLLALSMLCSTGVFANVGAEGSTEPALTEQQQNPAISVTYTPVLNNYLAFNGDGTTKNRVTYTEQTVYFEEGSQEYIVTVPYGTESVTVAPIETALGTVEGFALNFTGKDFAKTSFKIGDFTYDVTFKWEHEKPYIYNVSYQGVQPKRYIVLRGSDNGYIGYSTSAGSNISDETASVTVDQQLAWNTHENLSLTVNGKAISKAYSTVFTLSRFDNFVRAEALAQLANPGKVGWNETENWISFKASDAGTVYVQMSHANAKETGFVWPEGEAKGWTKETNVTGTDSVIYSLRFNAGDTVNIPSQLATQAEIDYVNAKLQEAYPVSGAYQFKYVLAAGNGYSAQLHYSNDGKAYDAADKTWTAISAGTKLSDGITLDDGTLYMGAYYRCANNTGLLIDPYGYKTFVVVAFDEPVEMEKLYYKIGDGELVEIESLTANAATVDFDECITGAVSLEGTNVGDGYWEYSDPVTLDENNTSGEVTATLYNANHEEIATYTITFTIPEKPAISVTYTPTLNNYLAFNGDGATKNRVTYTEQTKAFAAGPQEYIVTVPYGTESVTVAPIATALGTVEGFALDFTGKDFAETSFEIGGFTYDVTFKWEHEKPYIYNVSYQGVMPQRYIVLRGSDNGYIGYSTSASSNISGTTKEVTVDQQLAWNTHKNLSLTVNGKAISKAYSTVFTLSRFDNFVRAEALAQLANPGKVGWNETENWISFKASDAGTVYVQMSHANAKETGFVWPEGEAKGWTKETNVTGTDSVIYSLCFNAGDTVNIPSQVVTEAEIDYVNAKLQEAYPADGAYQFKYVLAAGNGYAAQLYYSEDKIAYDDPGKTWTAIPAGSTTSTMTLGDTSYRGAYYRCANNTGLSVTYGYKTFVVVSFDEPADESVAAGALTYQIGDNTPVEVAGEEVEVEYGTTQDITLNLAYTGNGTVEYSPEKLNLSKTTQSGSITATLKGANGAVVETRTVTFKWGAKPVAAITKLYYKIGDSELVDITGETEVEVSRGATNITLVAEYENGTIEYSPASLMLDEQTTSGSITATLKDVDDEVAEEHTVTFTWSEPEEPEVATLESLSYTTALSFAGNGKRSYAANARGEDNYSLFTGGFYQPTLVKTATDVTFEGTTINVTVPYGSEIVKLTGKNSLGETVVFDDVNLINNNGEVKNIEKTVGETTYTINVAWAAYDADADAAGNMVYDVKYKMNDLRTSPNYYYNIIPSKLVLTGERIPAQTVDGYNAEGKKVVSAGAWYLPSAIADTKTNLSAHSAGGALTSRRISTITFENWVRAGLITETGAPGAPLDAEASNDVVDKIAYDAMNGATTLVVNYTDFNGTATPAGTNKDMTPAYSFKVAQDSIVYVAWANDSIGDGWISFADAGTLKLHGQTSTQLQNEDGALFEESGYATHNNSSAASNYAFYRYAKAGEEVKITPSGTGDTPPIIFVRAIDFDALRPEATLTYTVGDGEAVAIANAEETITLPWGTTDAISVAAAITAGAGSAVVSDAITLSADNKEGTITVVIKDWEGNPVTTYTIKFAWGEEPKLASLSYTTNATVYKVATETNKAVDVENIETISVPWGTDNVTVTYQFENEEAVTLDAVSFINGAASVTIAWGKTVNFAWGAAPEGQYITDLNKDNSEYKDRIFVSFGDQDDAYIGSNSNYQGNGATFFGDAGVPEGLVQKGNVAVIADALANKGQRHLTSSYADYMYESYPATSEETAWMTFKVAKAGYVYYAPASFDGTWAEGESLGWSVAPFEMTWGNGTRKVYQKRVSAGETVLMPNNQVTDAEIAAQNATLTDYQFVKVTAEDIAKIEAAVVAAGYTLSLVSEGDWVEKYTDAYLAAAGENAKENYAGFVPYGLNGTAQRFRHYTRPYDYVLFAVAEECVEEAAKAPKWTGATAVKSGASIDLEAAKAAYGENAGEITFEIVGDCDFAEIKDGKLVIDADIIEQGKSVTIKVTQGEYSSTQVIAVTELAVTEYAYLTIKAPLGSGEYTVAYNEDPENAKNHSGRGDFGPTFYQPGERVVLTATPDEGYVFKFWQMQNKDEWSIYNRNATVTVDVPNNIVLRPVFAADTAYTVVFLGYQNETCGIETVTADSPDVEAPKASEVYGYKFVGWKCAAYGEEVLDVGDTIPATEITKDLTFEAIYELDASKPTYTLKVTNGVIDGVAGTTKEFGFNERVVVTADADAEGKIFQYWEDAKNPGEAISYSRTYAFYMIAADRDLVAVYGDAEQEIKPAYTLTVSVLDEANDDGTIFGLFAERRIPKGYTVVQNGIVAGYEGNNYGFTADDESVTLDSYNSIGTSKYQNNNGIYFVQFQLTEGRLNRGSAWYANAYITYNDPYGVRHTVYSPKVKLAVDEVEAPTDEPTDESTEE